MSSTTKPINAAQPTATRSKAALFSLLLGGVSLFLGPLPALLGLLIRALKAFMIMPYEGTIGIGGLLGIFSLLFGLPLALAALVLGRNASKKIRTGAAPIADRTRARLGISTGAMTLIAVPVLCLGIVLLLDGVFLYPVQHFLRHQGLANIRR